VCTHVRLLQRLHPLCKEGLISEHVGVAVDRWQNWHHTTRSLLQHMQHSCTMLPSFKKATDVPINKWKKTKDKKKDQKYNSLRNLVILTSKADLEWQEFKDSQCLQQQQWSLLSRQFSKLWQSCMHVMYDETYSNISSLTLLIMFCFV
jgi:hypothetical protein